MSFGDPAGSRFPCLRLIYSIFHQDRHFHTHGPAPTVFSLSFSFLFYYSAVFRG